MRACRLYQEFLCVSFAKVEALRLLYLTTNQANIRADVYRNVVDAVAVDAVAVGAAAVGADNEGGQPAVGRRMIMPATFVGGPRYMQTQ